MNEIFLMSQSRPIRGMQRSDGWTPQAIAEIALPAFKPDFYSAVAESGCVQLGSGVTDLL